MSDTTPLVYLIHCPDDNYKIGLTKNVDKRLSNLQGSCPFPLSIVATFETDRPRDDEADLHDALSYWKIHGEWFRLRPAFAERVIAFYEARQQEGPSSTLRLAEYVKAHALPDPRENGKSVLKLRARAELFQ